MPQIIFKDNKILVSSILFVKHLGEKGARKKKISVDVDDDDDGGGDEGGGGGDDGAGAGRRRRSVHPANLLATAFNRLMHSARLSLPQYLFGSNQKHGLQDAVWHLQLRAPIAFGNTSSASRFSDHVSNHERIATR